MTRANRPSRLIGLVPLLLLPGCSAAAARTFPVTDDEGLAKAIATARPGDRINLAPGVYAPIQVHGRRVEGLKVSVTGKDSRIQAISIINSSGWSFENISFGGAYSVRSRVVYIQKSSDIMIRNSFVHGPNLNNDPWDDEGIGVSVVEGIRIGIISSKIRDIKVAVNFTDSADINFEGNSIGFIREGSNWVSVRRVTIRCNRFSHFYPNFAEGEHPDAIQSWWINRAGGSENILIEGNFISAGGPRAVQGIFLQGPRNPGAAPQFRIRGLVIRDNIYYGSSRHGITLTGAEDFVVERNTVLASPYAQWDKPLKWPGDGRRSNSFGPVISVVGEVSTGHIRDNIAHVAEVPPGVLLTANQPVRRISDRGKAWKKLFSAPPVGDDPPLEHFKSKVEAGAQLVCGSLLPPSIDLPSGLDPSMADWPVQ